MFWSDPSFDLNVIAIFLSAIVIVSIVAYVLTKKIFLSIVLFSVGSNFIFYDNVSHRFASYFNVLWIFEFSHRIWPYINIILMVILIINFIKNKYAKTKNK
jgi:hypothetical protein